MLIAPASHCFLSSRADCYDGRASIEDFQAVKLHVTEYPAFGNNRASLKLLWSLQDPPSPTSVVASCRLSQPRLSCSLQTCEPACCSSIQQTCSPKNVSEGWSCDKVTDFNACVRDAIRVAVAGLEQHDQSIRQQQAEDARLLRQLQLLLKRAKQMADQAARAAAKNSQHQFGNLSRLLADLNYEVPCSETGMSLLSLLLGIVPTPRRKYSAFPQIAAGPDALIGEGGFALVYQAEAEDGEQVAVKCMRAALPFEQFLEQAEHWAGELLLGCAADHPNVMCCYGWDIEESTSADGVALFCMRMVMPRMVGSLEDVMKQGRLKPDLLMRYIEQASSGLHYLHTQMRAVHNDVKARNLLIDTAGNLKVADFGLSSLMVTGCTVVPDPCGHTKGYAAPEREGKVPFPKTGVSTDADVGAYACPASDMWALGVEMARLYRRVPAMYRPYHSASKVPRIVRRLVAACFAHDPELRIRADEMQGILSAWLADDRGSAGRLALCVYRRACPGNTGAAMSLPVRVDALSGASGESAAVSTIMFSSSGSTTVSAASSVSSCDSGASCSVASSTETKENETMHEGACSDDDAQADEGCTAEPCPSEQPFPPSKQAFIRDTAMEADEQLHREVPVSLGAVVKLHRRQPSFYEKLRLRKLQHLGQRYGMSQIL